MAPPNSVRMLTSRSWVSGRSNGSPSSAIPIERAWSPLTKIGTYSPRADRITAGTSPLGAEPAPTPTTSASCSIPERGDGGLNSCPTRGPFRSGRARLPRRSLARRAIPVRPRQREHERRGDEEDDARFDERDRVLRERVADEFDRPVRAVGGGVLVRGALYRRPVGGGRPRVAAGARAGERADREEALRRDRREADQSVAAEQSHERRLEPGRLLGTAREQHERLVSGGVHVHLAALLRVGGVDDVDEVGLVEPREVVLDVLERGVDLLGEFRLRGRSVVERREDRPRGLRAEGGDEVVGLVVVDADDPRLALLGGRVRQGGQQPGHTVPCEA